MVTDNIDDDIEYEKIIQKRNMNSDIQNEILSRFREEKGISHVGFFVLGGVFSEGIDLIGDALSGVIIVGVGLPQINDFNNLLRDYFNQIYNEGFDYAYTYPGMTKVIQSVGRVIRTEKDKGVCVLLDNRFETSKYQNLMPPHWTNKHYISNPQALRLELLRFYNEEKTSK
jgi:DNA excision repair protein ERCC-2